MTEKKFVSPTVFGRADSPHKKREIIERLAAAWERAPELRLGQLLGNCLPEWADLYFAEDYILIAELEKFYENGSALQGVPVA